MRFSYSVKFDTRFACYRARFWKRGGVDTTVKVPGHYWRELGFDSPSKPSDKLEKLALAWAAKDAERRDREERGELAPDKKKMTMHDVWALYRKENPRRVSEATMDRDAISFAAIERHPIEVADRRTNIGELLPEQIDDPVIVRYQNVRSAAKVRNAAGGRKDAVELTKTIRNRTVNNETDLLQRLVRFAWKWRRETGMSILVLDEVERLDDEESTQVALEPNEVRELLRVAPPLKRRMIIFGICSELREENLFGLRGEWIDWADSWLRIPAEFMKKGRSKKARELSRPLPAIAMEQLGTPRLKGYVWPAPRTGEPYTRLGLDELCAEAKIRPISEHDLRTTGNTWLHTAGVDHLTRKALMGHSLRTGDVTDLYTKVIKESMREAVAHFDGIFAQIMKAETSQVVAFVSQK
jgi:integrase